MLLVADSTYDRQMLYWLMPTLANDPSFRVANVLDDPTLQQFAIVDANRGQLLQDPYNAMNAWFLRHRLPRHDALHDAHALRSAWLAIRGPTLPGRTS